MKVLILYGSPNKNGDTRYILNKLKDEFPENTKFEEIDAYKDNIKPCTDCRYCWKNKGCVLKDKMEVIVKDDYDILIIASPVYMSFVTPPLFAIITRLNFIWSNKFFINEESGLKPKKGILVLAGGGDGGPEGAIDIAKKAFKFLNVSFDLSNGYIYSLKTDSIPVTEDIDIDRQIKRTMKHILK